VSIGRRPPRQLRCHPSSARRGRVLTPLHLSEEGKRVLTPLLLNEEGKRVLTPFLS
jgi:hypothetical protein